MWHRPLARSCNQLGQCAEPFGPINISSVSSSNNEGGAKPLSDGAARATAGLASFLRTVRTVGVKHPGPLESATRRPSNVFTPHWTRGVPGFNHNRSAIHFCEGQTNRVEVDVVPPKQETQHDKTGDALATTTDDDPDQVVSPARITGATQVGRVGRLREQPH